jgi:hypothetical protein
MNLNYLDPTNITIMFEYAELKTEQELIALRDHLLAAVQQETKVEAREVQSAIAA